MNFNTLVKKANQYKQVKQNTSDYRDAWQDHLKKTIMDTLLEISEKLELNAEIKVNDDVINLEAITFDLGRRNSGIAERLSDDESRPLVRNDGMLVYQQLFNGKIMALVLYPHLEGYSQQQPPKNLEILRPEELNQGYIVRHVEELLNELTKWEDYDDDQPSPPPIGFNSNFKVQADSITEE